MRWKKTILIALAIGVAVFLAAAGLARGMGAGWIDAALAGAVVAIVVGGVGLFVAALITYRKPAWGDDRRGAPGREGAG
ncbi:MAG: hypothetical protein EA376_04745 [Phycisphaeraceae bacterium]|nr:MAG: hypothetical protein EA376_04745 [Phycisphaeraceae bacterium]